MRHNSYSEDGYDRFYADITLTVNNCKFINCGPLTGNEIAYGAGALHIEGTSYIKYCIFDENFRHTGQNDLYPNAVAGAIYLYTHGDEFVEITNNEFTTNHGSKCGAILVQGEGDTIISKNDFIGNYYSEIDYIEAGYRSHALSVFNAAGAVIQNNVFIDNFRDTSPYGVVIGLSSYQAQAAQPLLFQNNTVVNTPPYPELNGIVSLRFNVSAEQDMRVQNNIFNCTNEIGNTIDSSDLTPPAAFKHNMLQNTVVTGFNVNLYNPLDLNEIYNPAVSYFNYECDPILNENYHPIWNSNVISPCIDAGVGFDIDGTPADIGAYAFTDHRFWEYRFEDQADVERWHWVSYPILNTITTDALNVTEFFKHLTHSHEHSQNESKPTFLKTIKWFVAGDDLETIEWAANLDYWLVSDPYHQVNSPQGYKIKFLVNSGSNYPQPIMLRHSGYKTPDHTEFNIYGGKENWIGYFRDDSRMPEDAFAAIWDDITMIKAKDWSLIRYGDPVNGMQILTGKMMPLNPGDMVIVKTIQDHVFQWGENNPVPPESKSSPQSFIYDEKEDYVPIYITLTDEMVMQYEEIGLYVDGICKGAVVVDENLEQISAYVANAEELNTAELELVFTQRTSKGAVFQPDIKKLNPANMTLKYGHADRYYPFVEINLTAEKATDSIPAPPSLLQNFPNPFNPETTISYTVNKATKLKLEIYNLRGQLIKILVNEEIDPGRHEVIWNGKDMNEKSVASGVYFYRLSTPEHKKTKKMLLMK